MIAPPHRVCKCVKKACVAMWQGAVNVREVAY